MLGGATNRFLTPNEAPGQRSRCFIIPAWFEQFVTGALYELSQPESWEVFGNVSVDDCTAAACEVILSMTNRIGTIEMTTGEIPVYGLLCDGSHYSRNDYPELWDVLPMHMKSTRDFIVPDLVDRFPMGGAVVGTVGGESQHTLTVDEMPIHDHGGHVHLNGEGIGEIPTPIPDVPVPDPLSSRGGGQPHNNLPPFFTVRFYIVAR